MTGAVRLVVLIGAGYFCGKGARHEVNEGLFATPSPLDEMQRTYDWLKSWGMLEETAFPLALVDLTVQNQAHQAAE